MTKKFSVLFAVDTTSHDDCSAVQRFRVLKAGLERLGVRTGLIYLGDYPIGSPRILLAANAPLYLETARQYDFVHAAGLSILAMSITKPLANYKAVFDVHGSTEEYRLTKKRGLDIKGNYQVLASMMTWRVARRRADYFVTVSEPLRQQILRQGVKEENTELIYNGVDTQLFKPTVNGQNGTFTVTYAGAYQKWQGVENLAEAANLLKNEEIKFKFMGFQKHDSALKVALKARLGENAELIDYQPRVAGQQPTGFVQEQSKSDVLIIPRYYDPAFPWYNNPANVRAAFGWLPTKFAEYTAVGRPVIVTNLDVASEFVEKYDCGFVCNPDPTSLAKAILRAKQTSPEELDRKGKNGRRLAEEQFDLQVIGKKYFDILSKLL
jgi:glycosyltransferase involved in cell wall biosynthesis